MMQGPTAAEKYKYVSGNCYDLAIAIHEQTGWLIGLEDWFHGGEYFIDGNCYPCCPDHAVAYAPNGMKVDINGAKWCDGNNLYGREILAEAEVGPEVLRRLQWREHDEERTAELAAYLVEQWRTNYGA